ncbi:MAG TPA: DUF6515 family protein [Steroidobacteraceae bacterium]|jgi:hypothetical protein|nr:DUF6515 family protein [Steroidobacteraceae bacterium]
MRKFSRTAVLSVSILLVAAAAAQLAFAQDHPRPEAAHSERDRPQNRGPAVNRAGPPRGQVLDSRYNHGRYYPSFGTVRPALPDGYRPYYRGRDRFYFSGGIWYAPSGPGFVVVRPPSGLVISVLPPYYSTVWFSGVPYYYADNVYYSWQPDQNGYAVVDPPENADSPSPPPDTSQQDLIIYPKNGQSKDQQAADQFECHTWAKGQTGFDPTQPGGSATGGAAMNRSNYDRAMSACLQARGYQVN